MNQIPDFVKLSGTIVLYLPLKEVWILLEAGLSGMIAQCWFEGHGCLSHLDTSGMMAGLLAGSRGMDASRTGVIRDDDGLTCWFEEQGRCSNWTYQG